jgi:hypothetical protein
MAMFSWHRLIEDDMHTQVVQHTCEGLPLVNEMLKEGIQTFSHPDDILIFLNRDICLVPQATGIIRTYMDLHNISELYAKRVDVTSNGLLEFDQLAGMEEYEGIDLFAFRPESPVIADLIKTPLFLGRQAWDNFWASRIRHKLPYKIAYHQRHESDWETSKGEEGNRFNLTQISLHSKQGDVGVEDYEKYFRKIK